MAFSSQKLIYSQALCHGDGKLTNTGSLILPLQSWLDTWCEYKSVYICNIIIYNLKVPGMSPGPGTRMADTTLG